MQTLLLTNDWGPDTVYDNFIWRPDTVYDNFIQGGSIITDRVVTWVTSLV
jgi:hypothetical protein